MTIDELKNNIRGSGIVHNTQPSTVSITQSCETGVVYKIDEIEKITEIAKKNNMKVHMDGARFSNAVVSLKKTPAEITWKSGIDVLTFGGTKNGCLDAEAIIFFKSEDIKNFKEDLILELLNKFINLISWHCIEQIKNGAELDFEDCMRMEYRMVSKVMSDHDFYEGVRALIIDKDNKPLWKPRNIDEISDETNSFIILPELYEIEA